jgi:hypothetical protein
MRREAFAIFYITLAFEDTEGESDDPSSNGLHGYSRLYPPPPDAAG